MKETASSRDSQARREPGDANREQKPVRLLIVDDHPLARLGLQRFVEEYEHLVAVGEAADGVEALSKAKELSPDVVLMDVDLPKLDGLAVTKKLSTEKPRVKVLILTAHQHPQMRQRIADSGARGFISKEASAVELVRAIELVAAGESFFPQTVTVESTGGAEAQQLVNKLSRRDREVLLALVEGLTTQQIAARLSLSARAVHTHRDRIKRKLNIRSVADLTRFAVEAGLVSV